MMDENNDEGKIRLSPFGQWVARKAAMLATGGGSDKATAGGYIGNDSKAVAAIAQLAHAAGHEVGADPDIFIWTVPDEDDAAIYPYGVPHDCAPTAEEMAAHLAMTLFAVQQQSHREQSMQTDSDMSLGRAVGMIAYGNFNEKGIRSTFDKMQTANGWAEMSHHARRLIKLLKREEIPLNYGLLAQDLVRLRRGRETANLVRLQWGRDYQSGYRAAMNAASDE